MTKNKILVAVMAMGLLATAGSAHAVGNFIYFSRNAKGAAAKVKRFNPESVRKFVKSKAFTLANKACAVCKKFKFAGNACKKAAGKIIGLGNKLGAVGVRWAKRVKKFVMSKGKGIMGKVKKLKIFGKKFNFKRFAAKVKKAFPGFKKFAANFRGKLVKGAKALFSKAKGKFVPKVRRFLKKAASRAKKFLKAPTPAK